MNTTPIQRPDDIPDGQPTNDVPYQAFANLTGEQARARFVSLYGVEPEQMFWYARMIWCGPVPQFKADI